MALAKRKPAEPAAAAPQFHVVPKEGEPAKKPALKGLNLGGLKPAAKTSEKPRIINPSPELIEVLTQFIQLKPQLTALEGSVKSLSSQAGQLAKPDWFRFWHGRADAESSMVVNVAGRDVSLIFQKRYSSKADASALEALGVAEHFAIATTISIDMDKVPEEQQQPFIDAIIALADKNGASEAITAKQALAPRPGIHAQRHVLFTPEQNIAIDNIIPLTAFPKL